MSYKDLTAFLTPDLVFDHHGTRYVVPPPSVDVGLKLAALVAAGISAFNSDNDALSLLTEDQRTLLESVKDTQLGELSLGPAYPQMVADGVPGPHVDLYALYAYYYWTLGEASADEIIAQTAGGPDPKAAPRKPSKSGRRSGSANRTRTGYTPTTESPTDSDPDGTPDGSSAGGKS